MFKSVRYPHNQHHGYDKLPTPRKLKSQQLPVRMTNFTQLSSCELFRCVCSACASGSTTRARGCFLRAA
jgi:hypothetical protein